MIGVVGGTGIYSLGKFKEKTVNTPYGKTQLFIGKIGKPECAFIARHGLNHETPPHKVNHRANIWALKEVDVETAIATYACGIISKFKPGDLIIGNDFVGFYTPITFYDDFKTGIKHTDFLEPYSYKLQEKLHLAGKNTSIHLKNDGIIATLHGPRYSTRAEISALKMMGANLVSMTNAYEATLFHEVGISNAALCIGTNYSPGIRKLVLSHSDVDKMVDKKETQIVSLITEFIRLI